MEEALEKRGTKKGQEGRGSSTSPLCPRITESGSGVLEAGKMPDCEEWPERIQRQTMMWLK